MAGMDVKESFCMRNCFTKLDSTLQVLTIKNTRAERLLKKNSDYLKKNNPDFKNIDNDPLESELEKFKGKFHGGTDRPFI